MRCGFKDVHLEIASTVDALETVQRVTEQIARRLGLDEETLHWTTLAVRESVMNAITHGNQGDPAKRVFVDFCVNAEVPPRDLIVRVRDQGAGFDPVTLEDPLAPENMLKASGRGIFLIRQFMDEVSVVPVDGGGTEIRMVKHLPPG